MDCFPALAKTFKDHTCAINSLAFSPDSSMLASGSWDTTTCIWSTNNFCLSRRVLTSAAQVHCVAWSPDSSKLGTMNDTGGVHMFDVPSGELITRLQAHRLGGQYIDFHPKANRFVTCGNDKIVNFWDSDKLLRIGSLNQVHTNWVRIAKYSPDGKYLATCCDDYSVRIFDAATGALLHLFKEACWRMAWHPNSFQFAISGCYNTLSMYDLKLPTESQLIMRFSTDSVANGLSFESSGIYLFTGEEDGRIHMYDLAQKTKFYSHYTNSEDVRSVAMSPDRNFVAAGLVSSHVELYYSKLDDYHNAIYSNFPMEHYNEKGEAGFPISEEENYNAVKIPSMHEKQSIATVAQKLADGLNNAYILGEEQSVAVPLEDPFDNQNNSSNLNENHTSFVNNDAMPYPGHDDPPTNIPTAELNDDEDIPIWDFGQYDIASSVGNAETCANFDEVD